MGVLDFAGGTVVHINAGIAALVCALVLGKRIGYGKEAMAPHNLVLTVIGASMLWVGWFGFNAGSAVAADGRAGMAMVVTQIATAAAALAWMFTEWLAKGKPSVLGIASGAVAGLVAITPASGFVGPMGALIIGIAAGVICFCRCDVGQDRPSATTTRSTRSACTASAVSSARCLPGCSTSRRSAASTAVC